MPIDEKLIKQLKSGKYSESTIDLQNQDLNDSDVKEIIQLLDKNPDITDLDLRQNKLSDKTVKLLAKNTTLKTLRLKPGNPDISLTDLEAFLENTTLTSLPFQGGSRSPQVQRLREHIKENADKPKIKENKKKEVKEEVKPAVQETIDTESGQDSFLQFGQHLIRDLDDFNSEYEYIVWYMAIALNFRMHNASHKPMPGFGAVRKLEEDHPLFYSRSQVKHPIRTQHDKIAKTESDTRKTSVGSLNPVVTKLVNKTFPIDDDGDYEETKKDKLLKKKRDALITSLKAVDVRRGFPNAGDKIPDYFSLFLAHGGLRDNNLRMLINPFEDLIQDDDEGEELDDEEKISLLKKKFKEQYPKTVPKSISKLDNKTASKRIKAIQERYLLLQQEAKKLPHYNQLQSTIQLQRIAMNKEIRESANKKFAALKAKESKKLLALESNGPACIIICINKESSKFSDLKTSAQRKDATEAILGFLCGLINYHAKKRGLSIQCDRRQSFGFLRSTLTDADEFELRLSLGLEPDSFVEVVIASLEDLHRALEATTKFPDNLSRMKSEKKQWQSRFEALYYLEQHQDDKKNNPVISAFNQYLNDFAINDECLVNEPEQLSKLANKKMPPKSQEDIFDRTSLFPLLQNLIKYAIDFAINFDSFDVNDNLHHFKHSYLHALLKLYQKCDDGLILLRNLNTYDVSDAYSQANTHIDSIIEYLIALDSLQQIALDVKGEPHQRILDLVFTEKSNAVKNFELSEEQVSVYFADSGQQAIVTSLLAMNYELVIEGVNDARVHSNIYNFNQSYYELNLFLKDIGGFEDTEQETSTIACIDITQLSELDFNDFPQLYVLVIDITRQPTLTNEALKNVVSEAHNRDIRVVLVSSSLKHDELGSDKYTSGKIVILEPNEEKKLDAKVTKIFKNVSEYSMHPAIASFLQMVNEICCEKPLPDNNKNNSPWPQLTSEGSKGLHRYGFTAKKPVPRAKVDSQAEPLDRPEPA